jgi:hypothetical protein
VPRPSFAVFAKEGGAFDLLISRKAPPSANAPLGLHQKFDGWPTFTFLVKVGTARLNVIVFLYTHPVISSIPFIVQNNSGATVKERRLQRRVKLERIFALQRLD